MINMGLYIVEKVVDGKAVDSHADFFEDYNDAVICMSELMQKREHEGETWHVRMLTEEEDEAMNVTYKRVDVTPSKPEGVSGGIQPAPVAEPPTPDCDPDKSDFLAVNHKTHAIYFLICMCPGITRKELRKRLAIPVIRHELRKLIDLDVIYGAQEGGKWRYMPR